jgi:hypothetical protein
MLSVIMLSVILPSVIMLRVITLNVILLSVIIQYVLAPLKHPEVRTSRYEGAFAKVSFGEIEGAGMI